jgi:hypothetical protein
MMHAIKFRSAVFADVDRPEHAYRQRVVIQPGTRLQTQLRPYVTDSADGAVEVADLTFDDGSFARAVQFAAFQFLDGAKVFRT